VGPDDVVYDLGCGDGRLVIEAARRGAKRGVGIDIDPELVSRAQAEARSAGVADRVSFRAADLFQSDFSDGTVVMLYLLPELNRKLRPQLWRQLRVGSRVVSHAFSMGDDWPPQHLETLQGSSIYVWTITAAEKAKA
jgi:ribosomal protein L11 methylase PrmA